MTSLYFSSHFERKCEKCNAWKGGRCIWYPRFSAPDNHCEHWMAK